ncbi:kinase-like protein [Ceratobasidium sp. AG-I]|nr:kinase-like protein [Ceratobasidium sp. AG-I]
MAGSSSHIPSLGWPSSGPSGVSYGAQVEDEAGSAPIPAGAVYVDWGAIDDESDASVEAETGNRAGTEGRPEDTGSSYTSLGLGQLSPAAHTRNVVGEPLVASDNWFHNTHNTDNRSSDTGGISSPTPLEPAINPRSRSSDVPVEPTTIGRMMPTSEVVLHLGDHGCQDVTALLDMSTSSTWPISSGGFGDIYRVKLVDSTEVAVKTTRIHINSSAEAKKHLKQAARELHAWAKCNHPNVLKLIGLAIFRGQLGMVSLWMQNGSLPNYLSQNPDANRSGISAQISEGLAYLHATNIVHGDLKGLNVLISGDGVPVLTDFGNAVMSNASLLFTATTSAASISLRWTAPELLESSIHTKEADIYALGMTILETITNQVPYAEKTEQGVMFCVWQRKLPDRPKEIDEYSDTLWPLLTSCWSDDPKQRPSAAQVAETMKTVARSGP